MLPYLIAGAIGYAVAKIFESDEAPKYADGGDIDYSNFRTSVIGLVNENKVLILQRGSTANWMPNKWSIVGGVIEEGEVPIEAMIRECEEEIGLEPSNVYYDHKIMTTDSGEIYYFVGTLESTDVKLDYENSAYKFISKDEIDNYDFVPYIKEFILSIFSRNTNKSNNHFADGGSLEEGNNNVLEYLFNNTEDVTPIKINGRTIGGIDVTTYRGDTETLRVHKMLILPEFQGKGIGSKAINKLFRENPNVKQIIGNATAESKSFWQKIGAEFHSNEHTAFTITRNPDIRFDNGGTTMKAPKLLAPNGKPSNLSPEQYKLVRLPEFKAWFGDWENDPANASKVVDSNGEPMVLYHGTDVNFNVFDLSKIGEGSDLLGKGIYLTENKDVANFYANLVAKKRYIKGYEDGFFGSKNAIYEEDADEKAEKHKLIYEFFVNAKNIKNINQININNDLKQILIKSISFMFGDKSEDVINSRIDFADKNHNQIRNYRGKIIYLIEQFPDAKKEILEYIKNKYDCIFFEPTTEFESNLKDYKNYVIFKPNQIKLADGTNTTFDGNNPDIRYADGGRVSNYREFYDNLQIEDGSKYIGQKFANVFPYIGKRTSPSQFRISVKEYNNLLVRLENDNYTTKGIKTADLNRLEKRQKYIDKKKYLSRFYLDPSGTIIGFDNSDNADY